MRALFDTNILVDEVAGYSQANDELRGCDAAYVSRIVWIELLVGAKSIDKPAIRTLLEALTILELTEEVALQTVVVRQKFPKLKLPDALIYATAQVHGLTFITRNTRDFSESMPGVRIPYKLLAE